MTKSTLARPNQGFTLVELMVALAIIAVLAVFALPAYRSSMDTAEDGALTSNVYTMEIFQEDFRLRTGGYANDLANVGEIENAIGWAPQSDDGTTYVIAASDGTFYQVTATHPDGHSVCVRFPERNRC